MHSNTLPKVLYTAAQVRELDRLVIEENAMSAISLMTTAGKSVYELICAKWPQGRITVFCGAGNNGGDGYIVAALAMAAQREVQIIQLANADKLTETAQMAYQRAADLQVPMREFSADLSITTGVIVDAALGTGLKGELREPYLSVTEYINNLALPVVAVDIPSGLCADTGSVTGRAVKADCTLTFIGLKRGLFTGDGPECCGELLYSDLEVPKGIFAQVNSDVKRICFKDYSRLFTPRPRQSHKGNFGHVLVVGGDLGYGGAVLLAAEASLRVGAGLVSIATRQEHVPGILARRPELMVTAVAGANALEPLIEQASVLVIGPGLGQSSWSKELLDLALTSDLPTVLDADGLNLLSKLDKNAERGHDTRQWIMTPHPGEMSRLLGLTTMAVQKDRFAAMQALQNKYACSLLLKGVGSLVCGSQSSGVGICDAGNPGMASGGMGDVLSGVIAGLLAQGLSLDNALAAGVCLHAEAADASAADGERGMIATDLFTALRRMVNISQQS